MTAHAQFSCIVHEGRATHVLVPIEDFKRAFGDGPIVRPYSDSEIAQRAFAILEDPATEWIDSVRVRKRLAVSRFAAIRKSQGISQAKLGAKVGLHQTQIARIEKNPDGASAGTLRRIAGALGVTMSELIDS